MSEEKCVAQSHEFVHTGPSEHPTLREKSFTSQGNDEAAGSLDIQPVKMWI